ncbi:unnamed protein product [Nippostrongylus brasiliensis]|uniref:guanylate cyclase n=1 Tax=Nippostrongylus brasiliensis TaxID=27835 RepID=A0A0N4XVC3_NIPBR|nr:unnamed protein product [Nippostrongylus brasiliensis]
MLLYALSLNYSIAAGISNPTGSQLVTFSRSIGQYEGFSGTVIINKNYSRDPLFLVYGVDATGKQVVMMRITEKLDNNSVSLVSLFLLLTFRCRKIFLFNFAQISPNDLPKTSHGKIESMQPDSVIWATHGGTPPSNRPACGFDGYVNSDVQGIMNSLASLRRRNNFRSSCPVSFADQYLVIIIVAVVVPVCLLVAAASQRQEQRRLNGLWQIPFAALDKPNTKNTVLSSRSLQSNITTSTKLTIESKKDTLRHAFLILDGEAVVARRHNGKPLLKGAECASMRKVAKWIVLENHDLDFLLHYKVSQWFEVIRSLQNLFQMRSVDHDNDVIEKGSLQMDWFFKYSLIRDISERKCEENLYLQGLHYLHHLFGPHGWLSSGTCLVDERWQVKITFFGIDAVKLTEARQQTELIYKIKRGGRNPIRPSLETEDEHNASLSLLVKDCWSEEPGQRPSSNQVKSLIKSLNRNKSANLMDHVFNVLEQYASNLEEEVQSRMQELTEEKKRSDVLLYRMLPRQVAEKLKLGQSVEPETFECVTLFFSDVVSFTTLASRCTPLQVVTLLNDLYTLFDGIIDEHDVYKVETIGDGYLCVSGLPHRNGNEHAKEIAEMSFELLDGIRRFRIPHLPTEKINIRVGLHTGTVVTGVVGMTMPRYCLFGDAVNTASRMESNGKPGRIHISTETMKFLTEVIGNYRTEPRGEVIVKGKGSMETHWLLTKEEQEQSNMD